MDGLSRFTAGLGFGLPSGGGGPAPPAGGSDGGAKDPVGSALGALGGAFGGAFGGIGGSQGSAGGGSAPGTSFIGDILGPLAPIGGLGTGGVHDATPVTSPPRPPGGQAFPPVFTPPVFTPPVVQPPPGFTPPVFQPPPAPPPPPQTATQLARSSIAMLNLASSEVLREALDTVRGRQLRPTAVFNLIERRTPVREVLSEVADRWSATTRADFADALQMAPEKKEVADAVVSIGVLNKPDLEAELRAENGPAATQQDMLDNRVIVEQWPPGGSTMQAPYLVLVAVESRDGAAEDAVQEILGQLVDFEGFKLPRGAVEKLEG
jgi:hypothetical protein